MLHLLASASKDHDDLKISELCVVHTSFRRSVLTIGAKALKALIEP